MSVPICRACCVQTGRTLLLNSLAKCPGTGQSSRQFTKNARYMSRGEWNFIRNFGNEMYKNYLLMRTLKKDTTCASRLTEWQHPQNIIKSIQEKTNKKAVKNNRLKVMPSIPFTNNFDFLKKLNYNVGAGAATGQLSRPLKAQQQRTYEDSGGLKYCGKLRSAGTFEKVSAVASPPGYKLRDSGGPVNTTSQANACLPGVGRVHANWFGHDVKCKICTKTGAVELDFATSPTAALAEQRYEAFEPSSVFRLPKDSFRFKTFPKTKVRRECDFNSKHRALDAAPYANEQKRELRYYDDLVPTEDFQPNKDDMFNYSIVHSTMRGFGFPMCRDEVRQGNMLTTSGGLGGSTGPTKYLTFGGVSDQIQIPGAATNLRRHKGLIYNIFNGAPALGHISGIPRGLGHLLDANYLRYAMNPPQNYLTNVSDGLASGKSGVPHQGKLPVIAGRLGSMEAYRYLIRNGALPQADINGTMNCLDDGCIGVVCSVNPVSGPKQPTTVKYARGLGSKKSSNYVPFVEIPREPLQSGLENVEAYKYLRHLAAPLQGHLKGAARRLRNFEDFKYLAPTAVLQHSFMFDSAGGLGSTNKYWEYAGVPSGDFDQRKVPKYFGPTHVQENVAGTATESTYVGDSGYSATTDGRGSIEVSRNVLEHIRPFMNSRESRTSRRVTGSMTPEAPRLLRHTDVNAVPRQKDSSGIEADLAVIRGGHLSKHHKAVPQGLFTYNKFPRHIGRTFRPFPTNAAIANVEAMKHLRRPVVPNKRNRLETFAGYESGDHRVSRDPESSHLGTVNDLSYAAATKHMRRPRAPPKGPSYLDHIGDSRYARHPRVHRQRTNHGSFDYTTFGRHEGKIPKKFQANAFKRDPFGINLVQQEENFDTQSWENFPPESGYIYDIGYTGHSYPFYSEFFDNANYGLKDIHNTAMFSLEKRQERERGRLQSLNLFYNIINYPGMEMEVSPEEVPITYDHHAEENEEEERLSLIQMVQLLKSDRKRNFYPVLYHEPFDKEKPWTWIQNFPTQIPNQFLERLPIDSLQSLKAWLRLQTLLI